MNNALSFSISAQQSVCTRHFVELRKMVSINFPQQRYTMHNDYSRSAGYSRLEIAFILVLVLFVGLLAVTKYFDISREAEQAMEPGLIEGVRDGIAAYAEESRSRGNSQHYPTVLDEAEPGASTSRDLFFDRVLEKGVAVEGWSKLERNQYRTPSGKRIVYNPQTGEFLISAEGTSPTPEQPPLPDKP